MLCYKCEGKRYITISEKTQKSFHLRAHVEIFAWRLILFSWEVNYFSYSKWRNHYMKHTHYFSFIKIELVLHKLMNICSQMHAIQADVNLKTCGASTVLLYFLFNVITQSVSLWDYAILISCMKFISTFP